MTENKSLERLIRKIICGKHSKVKTYNYYGKYHVETKKILRQFYYTYISDIKDNYSLITEIKYDTLRQIIYLNAETTEEIIELIKSVVSEIEKEKRPKIQFELMPPR